MFHKHKSTFLTHNSQLTVEILQRGLRRPLRPVEFTFSNFLGESPAAGAPRQPPYPTRALPGLELGAQSPAPYLLCQQRPGAVERKKEKEKNRERERKGKGRSGREKREWEGEEGARAGGPGLGRPGRGSRGRLAPLPGPGPALTFQVAAGGRREPLLRFAAHQLQANLQHFRVPAASGLAPLSSTARLRPG